MSVQYISDSRGKKTGVFIPIDEWNILKKRYEGIEDDIDVPEWHKNILNERLEEYRLNPESAEDIDSAIDEIENNL